MTTKRKPSRKVKAVAYLTAEFGRLGQATTKVAFKTGETVSAVLNRADISLSEGEALNDERANEVSLNSEAKAQTYFIVGNFKNG